MVEARIHLHLPPVPVDHRNVPLLARRKRQRLAVPESDGRVPDRPALLRQAGTARLAIVRPAVQVSYGGGEIRPEERMMREPRHIGQLVSRTECDDDRRDKRTQEGLSGDRERKNVSIIPRLVGYPHT